MYMSPIVRTYYSMEQYRSDAGQMQVRWRRMDSRRSMSSQSDETNGCLLTFLLITGLLLTPVCIGILFLLLIPAAFSKRYNVSYVYHPTQSQPFIPPSYSRPLVPPAYRQPLAPPAMPTPYPQMTPAAQDYQPQPPQQLIQQTSFSARFREGMATLQRVSANWTPGQRALATVESIIVVVVAVTVTAIVLVALASGGGGASV